MFIKAFQKIKIYDEYIKLIFVYEYKRIINLYEFCIYLLVSPRVTAIFSGREQNYADFYTLNNR